MNDTQIPRLRGLVLSGGKSSRMGSPKAEINYHGEPEFLRCIGLLKTVCDDVYLSTSEFWTPTSHELDSNMLIPDEKGESIGPLSGICSAFKKYPESAWVVLACDLPMFDRAALAELTAQRDSSTQATCFVGYQHRPEPLCAIYEPSAASSIATSVSQGKRCARSALENMRIKRVAPLNANWVRNVNDKDELATVMAASMGQRTCIEIQYVAQLREAAGMSIEKIHTDKATARALYEDLRHKHGFLLKPQHMRVAINDEIVDWDRSLQENDRIMFVPPVAGG